MSSFSVAIASAQSWESRVLQASDYETAKIAIDGYVSEIAAKVTATGTHPAPMPPMGMSWYQTIKSPGMSDSSMSFSVDQNATGEIVLSSSMTFAGGGSQSQLFYPDIQAYLNGKPTRIESGSGGTATVTKMDVEVLSGVPYMFPIKIGAIRHSEVATRTTGSTKMGSQDLGTTRQTGQSYESCIAVGEEVITLDGFPWNTARMECGSVSQIKDSQFDIPTTALVYTYWVSLDLGLTLRNVSKRGQPPIESVTELASLDRSAVEEVNRQAAAALADAAERQRAHEAYIAEMEARIAALEEQRKAQKRSWGLTELLGLASGVLKASSALGSIDSMSSNQQMRLLTELVGENAREGSFLGEIAGLAGSVDSSSSLLSGVENMSESNQAKMLTGLLAQDTGGQVQGEISKLLGQNGSALQVIAEVDNMSTSEQAGLLAELIAQGDHGTLAGEVAGFINQAQTAMNIVAGVSSLPEEKQAELLQQVVSDRDSQRSAAGASSVSGNREVASSSTNLLGQYAATCEQHDNAGVAFACKNANSAYQSYVDALNSGNRSGAERMYAEHENSAGLALRVMGVAPTQVSDTARTQARPNYLGARAESCANNPDPQVSTFCQTANVYYNRYVELVEELGPHGALQMWNAHVAAAEMALERLSN